jgi:hypothetical protein
VNALQMFWLGLPDSDNSTCSMLASRSRRSGGNHTTGLIGGERSKLPSHRISSDGFR